MSIKDQIAQLEKQEADIQAQKKKLAEELKLRMEREAKLDQLVEQSGFGSARDLVLALIDKYNLRITKRIRGNNLTRRKRTRVTPELRNAIKKEVKAGTSMNKVSKQFEISYAVVNKIMKGQYDKLK